MRVADIYNDIKAQIGNCNQEMIYSYLSTAITQLSNATTWDYLQAYLDINVSGYEVVLPDFVDGIIRVNINKNPTFYNDRIAEFSQNSDGSVLGDEVGWQWSDRGTSPFQSMPEDSPYRLRASENNAVIAYGYDVNGNEIVDGNGDRGYKVTNTLSGPLFHKVYAIKKLKTDGTVDLFANSKLVATYDARDYTPTHRVIKLSKSATSVRMLIRRKAYAVSGMDDWIPIDNRYSLILMVKSIYLMMKGQEMEQAAALEAKAVEILNAEQSVKNVGAQLASDLESKSIRNQSYLSTDCVVVRDIYDDFSNIFGPIGRERIFNRIQDAVEILSNKSQWDSTVADLVISGRGNHSNEFTLPNFVSAVLKVRSGSTVLLDSDKWFSYHINGTQGWGPSSNSWQDLGEFATYQDLKEVSDIVVQLSTPDDNDIQVRVKGYDENGREVWTNGEEGYVPPALYGNPWPAPNAPRFSKVTSVMIEAKNDAPKGYVKVQAVDAGRPHGTLLALLGPGQRQTNYRRIKVGTTSKQITCKVKLKPKKISSLEDILPTKSRLALVHTGRSIFAAEQGDAQNSVVFSELALQLLEDESEHNNPSVGIPIQYNPHISPGGIYDIR